MKIVGAVLTQDGAQRPYGTTRPLVVGELDLDPPGADEVLVKITAASLCHSDLSVIDGNRKRPTPMLLGHEATGTVEQVGPEVDTLQVGDHVIMTFMPRCGECEGCHSGGIRPCVPGTSSNTEGSLFNGGRRLSRDGAPVHHHLGVSGFATHAVVDRRSLVRVDADVPPEVAAVMGCAVLTGGGAILNVAKPKPGDSVLVVGLGGVGMAAVLTALALDGVKVFAVDPLREKLDMALELGASGAYTPEEADEQAFGASIVIEAVGHAKVLESAIGWTLPGGRTITVGLPSPTSRTEISPTALVAEGRSIIGSYLGSAVPQRDIPRFVELWRDGKLPVERLISGRMPLAEINEGMELLAGGTAIRQIIEFD